MTFTQIECFVEAAKLKSLSKAAANLFISQPTISRQIKALEVDLGFPLFERKNVGVRLTPMGEILYTEWSEMLLVHRGAVDKAKDLYFGELKLVRIGILDLIGFREKIANTLVRYNQKYPDLDVEYSISQIQGLLSGIENGEFHIIITYASEIEDTLGLRMMYLDEIPMRAGIICSRQHPLSKKKQLGLSDLRGKTLGVLANEASTDHKKRIQTLLEENHLAEHVKLKEFGSRHNLQIALTAGKCVAVMYEDIVAGREDELQFYPLELKTDNSKIVIAWKEDKYSIKAKNIAQIY